MENLGDRDVYSSIARFSCRSQIEEGSIGIPLGTANPGLEFSKASTECVVDADCPVDTFHFTSKERKLAYTNLSGGSGQLAVDAVEY